MTKSCSCSSAVTWLIVTVVIVTFLGLMAIAFGETTDPTTGAPEFPFKNLAQLDQPIPDFVPDIPHRVSTCRGHDAALGRFRNPAGEIVWQVYVQLGGTRFTGAYYLTDKTVPAFVYHGVYQENGRMNVTRVEAFDPAKHLTPCDEWGTSA